MPNKRNPVLTENLTGLACSIRMSAIPALENITLWHERDISYLSIERAIAPDTPIILDFALNRLASVIENLVVYPEEMQKNLNQLGRLDNSQRVLLALTQDGVSRENSYAYVQRNAMNSWKEGLNFQDLLKKDVDVMAVLKAEDIDEMFDLECHTKHVDTIFKRVFAD